MNRYVELVKTLAEPANTVEDLILQVYTRLLLRYAYGPPLDVLGSRVGQPRNGLSDEDYVQAIAAKIWINRSTGSFRDVKRVVLSFVPTVAIESGGGVALIRVGNINFAKAEVIYKFAAQAIEAAVRLQVLYLPSPPVDTFTLARAAVTLEPISGGSVLVQGANNLPDFGTVFVGVGTALYEVADYTSRTDTHLHGLTTANAHPSGTALQLTNNASQGYGDSVTPGTGGHFAGVVGS